jgi:hypothetical protein
VAAFNFDPESLRGLESGCVTFEIESPGPQTHCLAAFSCAANGELFCAADLSGGIFGIVRPKEEACMKFRQRLFVKEYLSQNHDRF